MLGGKFVLPSPSCLGFGARLRERSRGASPAMVRNNDVAPPSTLKRAKMYAGRVYERTAMLFSTFSDEGPRELAELQLRLSDSEMQAVVCQRPRDPAARLCLRTLVMGRSAPLAGRHVAAVLRARHCTCATPRNVDGHVLPCCPRLVAGS